MNQEVGAVARNFDELASGLKEQWSDDATRTYQDATASYARELEVRRTLGRAVAAIRQEQGLTQTALARATSIQQAEISRIERGHGNPTVDTLARLAAALGRELSLTAITSEAS